MSPKLSVVIILLCEAFPCVPYYFLYHSNYLSSVAIRGKLARDNAKRIKEKRAKSDIKLKNKS